MDIPSGVSELHRWAKRMKYALQKDDRRVLLVGALTIGLIIAVVSLLAAAYILPGSWGGGLSASDYLLIQVVVGGFYPELTFLRGLHPFVWLFFPLKFLAYAVIWWVLERRIGLLGGLAVCVGMHGALVIAAFVWGGGF